ncbi:MAG TPA: DUF4265 domain-containing protein [Acidobacteriaceae bacterium]
MTDDLVKIVIEVSDPDFGVSGESLWARPLGNDLYEIENSPWHTLEINYKDIVRAIAPDDDSKPVFVEVVRRGGHRSIHIYFLEDGLIQSDDILKGVNTLGATWEGMDKRLYAVDLAPTVEFDTIADYLEEFQKKNLIELRYAAQPQAAGSGELIN